MGTAVPTACRPNKLRPTPQLHPNRFFIGRDNMPRPISGLSESDKSRLLSDLNYLNMSEIRSFCERHSIPFSIWVETSDGRRRKTRDTDRKGVVLDRIRHFLKTGKSLPATCFPASVVCLDDLPKTIKPSDRLYYGQYDKQSRTMIGLLEKMTDGQFKNGAVARILAREFWGKGIAPTYREFAAAWLKAKEDHKRPNPEWAFLSDRTDRKDTSNWKRLRNAKAKRVLEVLRNAAAKSSTESRKKIGN